jgi:hypothetical protein
MKMATKQSSENTVSITAVQSETIRIAVIGTSPLIFNRMAEKARQQLLMGAGKKTAAEKAGQAKHDPLAEYRASPYRMRNDDAPTMLGFPSSAFKGAMETAALETPGAKKAQVGRLISVSWDNVAVYGVPKIFCSITRSADMAKTPDVRTRAILPEWAAVIDVSFVTPTLRAPMVMTLLANAGIVSGIGDWRQEKGAGNFGAFRVVDPSDEEFQRILKFGGRAAQQKAIDNPQPFDQETAELLSWYSTEFGRRGFKAVA